MYTNNTGLSLSVALWLANDEYDHNSDPHHISATSLLKSPKQLILPHRVPKSEAIPDVQAQAANRIGSAIHNAIENAWNSTKRSALLAMLSLPQKAIDRIRVNPTAEDLAADPTIFPVYMEQRATKKVGAYTVSGKFDFIIDGMVEDFKSTSTYVYVKGTNKEEQSLQGSIYRWLNPTLITKDHIAIQYIFKDWKAALVKQDPAYPKQQIIQVKIPLISLAATEKFITEKIALVVSLSQAKEEDMPDCTPKELWQGDTSYKYYKNPKMKARSTKNFTESGPANQRLAEDGYIGVVDEVRGKVVRCKYCKAAPICKQKDRYIMNGTLVL